MHIKPKATIYCSNVGLIDRVVRFVASAAMVASFMAYQEAGTGLYAGLALLAIPVFTSALLRWDPIYALLGVNTTGEVVGDGFAEQNMGNLDRTIRYGVSGAMVVGFMVTATAPIGASALLPLLAIVVFGTAVTGWCPLYTLGNLSTRPVRESGEILGFNGEPQKVETSHGKKAA